MKIAVVNNIIPFVFGGAEKLADDLKIKLIEYGHQVTSIKIPFSPHPAQKILENVAACRLLSLEDSVDKVIAFKFPSYYIKHPNKTLWLIHQFRQVYDLWGTEYQNIPRTDHGLRIRDYVVKCDNILLKEPKKIYTNSKIVSRRLKHYNDIDSEVLYPPILNPKQFHFQECGNFIFCPSRITKIKRQSLAIESMRYTKTGVKLVIAGSPDTDGELNHINKLIEKYNLKSKVKVIARWIFEKDKIDLLSKSLACIYIPYNEDSYGYVSLESFYSQKPVITCNDSGGTSELIDNGINGYISDPDPKALAQIMDDLYSKKKLARKLGTAGYEKLMSMDIGWNKVLQKLLK